MQILFRSQVFKSNYLCVIYGKNLYLYKGTPHDLIEVDDE